MRGFTIWTACLGLSLVGVAVVAANPPDWGAPPPRPIAKGNIAAPGKVVEGMSAPKTPALLASSPNHTQTVQVLVQTAPSAVFISVPIGTQSAQLMQSVPLVTQSAPIFTQSSPIHNPSVPLRTQSTPLLAQSTPVLAQSAPVYLTLSIMQPSASAQSAAAFNAPVQAKSGPAAAQATTPSTEADRITTAKAIDKLTETIEKMTLISQRQTQVVKNHEERIAHIETFLKIATQAPHLKGDEKSPDSKGPN